MGKRRVARRIGLLAGAAVLAGGVAGAAPGARDRTFSQDGRNTANFNQGVVNDADGAEDVLVQPDGKVVVVGDDFEVIRFSSNGALDLGFGLAGKIKHPRVNGFATAAALDGSRRIVVGGINDTNDFALVRFTPDGIPDLSFGEAGVASADFGSYDELRDIQIMQSGHVVAGGIANTSVPAGCDEDCITYSRFALARFDSHGVLDGTFGAGGKVATDFGDMRNGEINALGITPDAKIVAAGLRYGSGTDLSNFAILRYTLTGALDSGFGSGGIVVSDLSDDEFISGVAVQSDGKIVVGGAGWSVGNAFVEDAIVARFGITGALDSGFGTGGTFIFADGPGAVDVALQASGKIVAALGSNRISLNRKWRLIRLGPSGALTPGFGTGGVVTTEFPDLTKEDIISIAIHTNGKIIAAGSGRAGSDPVYAVARYLGS